MTNTVAWMAIAIAGMTATHHCLVSHQIRPTMMTQTPMTISVFPMRDQTMVMVSQVAVRPACRVG